MGELTKEPIEGVCDNNNVYVIIAMFKKQTPAVCPVSDKEIEKQLNAEVQFLKDNPAHEDEGMVSLTINCKGEVVQCYMGTNTKSTKLDEQIVAVFKSLGVWKAGKIKKTKVDSVKLVSFKIVDGVITL